MPSTRHRHERTGIGPAHRRVHLVRRIDCTLLAKDPLVGLRDAQLDDHCAKDADQDDADEDGRRHTRTLSPMPFD